MRPSLVTRYRLQVTGFWSLVTIACAAWAAPAPAPEPPMPYTRMGVANGCFVETVAFLDAFQDKLGAAAWSRLLQWDGGLEDDEKVVGHAVGVCEVRGKIWCWDINYGWTALAADPSKKEDLATVGAQAAARYGRQAGPNYVYRFDFAQPAGEAPKPGGPPGGGAALADARQVAERLAARRPVNLVTFSYPANGVERSTAVVIFQFHGRYCVYCPETGTVPFRRMPGTVQTIATYQAVLRRVFPGAHDFHSP